MWLTSVSNTRNIVLLTFIACLIPRMHGGNTASTAFKAAKALYSEQEQMKYCNVLQQTLANREFQLRLSAVFHLYPVLPTAAFGFMCQRALTCVHMLTSLASTTTDHFHWVHGWYCNRNQNCYIASRLPLWCVLCDTFLDYYLLNLLLRILCVYWRNGQLTLWRVLTTIAGPQFSISWSWKPRVFLE
jgi:hypothetical protein